VGAADGAEGHDIECEKWTHSHAATSRRASDRCAQGALLTAARCSTRATEMEREDVEMEREGGGRGQEGVYPAEDGLLLGPILPNLPTSPSSPSSSTFVHGRHRENEKNQNIIFRSAMLNSMSNLSSCDFKDLNSANTNKKVWTK
jgi:hypothetical protein